MGGQQYIAGVDLGGTKIYAVAATLDGQVLGEYRCLTHAEEGPGAVVERMADAVQRALDAAGIEGDALAGVGISTPGPCDPARGIVTDAPNLPGWHNVPLTRLLGERLGLPAVLENDANAAAYGEYRYGAGQGVRHLLYVTVSTGIGGGVIVDGALYQGASGAAGEVGHMILEPDGPQCGCGNRGCLEALASGLAIARDATELLRAGQAPALARLVGQGEVTAELVGQAAVEGDVACQGVVERAGRYLGLGFVGMLHCFNPEALVVGGGLVGLGERYLGQAWRLARERAFPQVAADVRFATAGLGERAGALGAAALLIERQNR